MNGDLVIYSPGHKGNEWGLKKDKLSKIRILYMYNADFLFLTDIYHACLFHRCWSCYEIHDYPCHVSIIAGFWAYHKFEHQLFSHKPVTPVKLFSQNEYKTYCACKNAIDAISNIHNVLIKMFTYHNVWMACYDFFIALKHLLLSTPLPIPIKHQNKC